MAQILSLWYLAGAIVLVLIVLAVGGIIFYKARTQGKSMRWLGLSFLAILLVLPLVLLWFAPNLNRTIPAAFLLSLLFGIGALILALMALVLYVRGRRRPAALRCPHCHAERDPSWRYCPYCEYDKPASPEGAAALPARSEVSPLGNVPQAETAPFGMLEHSPPPNADATILLFQQKPAFAYLEVLLGANAGEKFSVHDDTYIGRQDGVNEIVLDDGKVSRVHHARIRIQNGNYVLIDSSSNGTFFQTAQSDTWRKSPTRILSDGMKMRLGDTVLVFRIES